MSDPLTDLITDIQHNGLRWLSIVTLYAIYRKERRNYYLDRRDDALFQNLKIMMNERGLGECFVENPNSKKNLERELLEHGLTMLSPAHIATLFTRRKVTEKSISRRKTKMKLLLTNPWSKKLFAFLLLVIVNGLNDVLGLHLSPATIERVTTLGGTYILAQAGVDAIKPILLYVVGLITTMSGGTQNVDTKPTGDSGAAV